MAPQKNPKENPVNYPPAPERRFHLWLNRRALWIIAGVLVLPLVAAWVLYLASGLPALAPEAAGEPLEFPLWLRIAHYTNFLLLVLLVRSGLSILMDHPRLYWNDHCTPGTEWIRFTPVEVPKDAVFTAKEDARYISPLFALPGYKHTIGMARHWHFLPALLWFINGVVFWVLLFATGQFTRLVPDSAAIVADAWAMFVHYATFNIPEKGETLVHYNALQQLSYFGVVFIMAPLSFLTAMAMSPAIVNRFRWYPRLFGGRQAARSIHFLLMVSYVLFLVGHVAMVAVTGLTKNMNHIVVGADDGTTRGLLIGLVGIAVVVLACGGAHWLAWKFPRAVQYLVKRIHGEFMRRLFFAHIEPRAEYPAAAISPHFWPNGKAPASDEWKGLAADDFKGYKLKVTGLVENPVELSLEEMRALGMQEQTTMHHCIQGWSGIAKWGGLPMRRLVEVVKPKPEAKVVVFYSFGEGLYGGDYYDTQQIENVMREKCILAYEMNGQPLPHVYGAPLRLRVENQLGYKMVKWVRAIEFVAAETDVGLGHGGKNEDDEYFDLVPEI